MKTLHPGRWAKSMLWVMVVALGAPALFAGTTITDDLTAFGQSELYGRVRMGRAGVATNGLQLYFSFSTNGSSTVADESGNGNTGTVVGATWTTNGVRGGAYDFNGTSTNYIEVAGSASLNVRTNLTMAGWVYFKGEGLNNGLVLSKKCAGGLQYGMGRYSTSYGAHTHKPFVGLNVGSYADYRAECVLNDNEWYHLVATYDCTNVKLYVNGALQASYAKTGVMTGDGTSRLTVGADANAPTWNEFTKGIIDEVRVYGVALSAEEVSALYAASRGAYATTNAALEVEGPALIKRLVIQGDIQMGGYTNGP